MKLVVMREFIILKNMKVHLYRQLTTKKGIKLQKLDITEKLKTGIRKKLI